MSDIDEVHREPAPPIIVLLWDQFSLYVSIDYGCEALIRDAHLHRSRLNALVISSTSILIFFAWRLCSRNDFYLYSCPGFAT